MKFRGTKPFGSNAFPSFPSRLAQAKPSEAFSTPLIICNHRKSKICPAMWLLAIESSSSHTSDQGRKDLEFKVSRDAVCCSPSQLWGTTQKDGGCEARAATCEKLAHARVVMGMPPTTTRTRAKRECTQAPQPPSKRPRWVCQAVDWELEPKWLAV